MIKIRWGVSGSDEMEKKRSIPRVMRAHNPDIIASVDINIELAEKMRKEYKGKREL
jgi:predicted dehydrogenase